MAKRLCRRCEYYEEVDGDGYCYRFPPRLVVVNKTSFKTRTNPSGRSRQEVQSEYPIVDKNVDWCGEYKKREEEVVIDAD